MENSVKNTVRVVLGAQWGDEGKGKLVDLLAENADVVARCQVSAGVQNSTIKAVTVSYVVNSISFKRDH